MCRPCRVVPLRRRQLPALVCYQVLSAVIIRLCQNRGDGPTAMLLASVVNTARLAGSKVRSTGTEDRAIFQGVKAHLRVRGPHRHCDEPCRSRLPRAVRSAASSA